ncbi:MAG: hypothetical protein ABL900_15345 [Burkholderiaceae bacterium]
MAALGNLAIGVTLLGVSSLATAAEISIKVRDCKAGVELIARDAPLSQVLRRLAKSLAFQLDVDDTIEGLVTLRATAPGPELIAQLLAAQERVMVSHARDPRCPGKSRVSRIWLLAQGKQVARRDVREASLKPAALAAHVATPEQLRAQDEATRRLKQEYDEHVQRHGKPPDGEEQEEAKP